MIRRDYNQEREDYLDDREVTIRQAEAKRAHELEMAKLKLSVKPRNDKWRAIVKAPTYPLVIICITIISLAGKPVPSVLEDFLAK